MALPAGSISNAVSAYQRASNSGISGIDARDKEPEQDFSDLVKGAIREAVKINQQSENVSLAAVADRADLNEVVTAIAEAELTLRTVVSVRDKVIEAYKDILRMPI
ncbi:MAG: flagellar hook-basal body complex protein FliE [Rhodospirillales bacterium]|nr:flagellar hook-basal body complex protein FliE [Rhodospirillales bacterium]